MYLDIEFHFSLAITTARRTGQKLCTRYGRIRSAGAGILEGSQGYRDREPNRILDRAEKMCAWKG